MDRPILDRAEHLAQLWIKLGLDAVPDFSLLDEALTHSAVRDSSQSSYYERLEFLGDSVLGAAVAVLLHTRFPDRSEGALSVLRSRMVERSALVELSSKLGLIDYAKLPAGCNSMSDRVRSRLASDMMEALCGVVFLVCGWDSFFHWVSLIMDEDFIHVRAVASPDPKTRLQQLSLKRFKACPVYQLVERRGLLHDSTFLVRVVVGNAFTAEGIGHNKREAGQDAARRLMKRLEE